MNKWMKISMVLVVILACGGILLSQYLKEKAIVGQQWQEIWSVDSKQFEISSKLINIEERIVFDDHYVIWRDTLEKQQIDITNVKQLKLSAGGVILTIKDSEDGLCYVEGTNIGKLQAFVTEETLQVMSLKSSYIKDEKISNITLYLPKNQIFETIDVAFGAGQLVIDDVNAQEFSANVGAGELIVHSGSIDILEVNVGAGNCKMEKVEIQESNIACAAGNVQLSLVGAYMDYNYSVKVAVGVVKIGDVSYSGLTKQLAVDNNVDKKIDVECAVGNVLINFS